MRSHSVLFYIALRGQSYPLYSMGGCHPKSMDRKLAFNIWIACFSFINQASIYMCLDSYILHFYCLNRTTEMIDL